MFRARATTKRSDEDLDRPFRLVSVPAFVALLLAFLIISGGALWLFGGQVSVRVPAAGVIVNPPENVEVVTAVGGVVESGPPPEGQVLEQGQVVAQIRAADGTLSSVMAPTRGTVVSLGTATNAPVVAGEAIVTLAHDEVPMIGIVFAPTNTVPGIVPGDPVNVQPISADVASYGLLSGTVQSLTSLPVSAERVEALVTDPALAEQIMAAGTVHEITVALATAPDDPSQLVWSAGAGPTKPPVSGEIISTQIVIAEQSPWQALISGSG